MDAKKRIAKKALGPPKSSLQSIFSKLDKNDVRKLSPKQLPTALSHSQRLLNQRDRQRNTLFWFILFWTSFLMTTLLIFIIIQAVARIRFGPQYALIDPIIFNVFAVSVIAQFVGIMLVIAKSLYDDGKYLSMINSDGTKRVNDHSQGPYAK